MDIFLRNTGKLRAGTCKQWLPVECSGSEALGALRIAARNSDSCAVFLEFRIKMSLWGLIGLQINKFPFASEYLRMNYPLSYIWYFCQRTRLMKWIVISVCLSVPFSHTVRAYLTHTLLLVTRYGRGTTGTQKILPWSCDRAWSLLILAVGY